MKTRLVRWYGGMLATGVVHRIINSAAEGRELSKVNAARTEVPGGAVGGSTLALVELTGDCDLLEVAMATCSLFT